MKKLIVPALVGALLVACASSNNKLLDQQLRPRSDDISLCYIQVLRTDPAAKGEIEISIAVDGAGKVIAADLVKNTFPDDRVGACVAAVIKSVSFPPTNQNKTTTFSYPIMFTSETPEHKQ
ncbi:MAG TPA: AgmX/PglI C-terminal domain-containing protein [bacterium]|nr:AgmX/PglI C-terminal domain-containing protein [bacterium]